VVQCLKVASGEEKLPEPANSSAADEQATTARRLPLPA
jgi:hypothetical protein